MSTGISVKSIRYYTKYRTRFRTGHEKFVIRGETLKIMCRRCTIITSYFFGSETHAICKNCLDEIFEEEEQ